MSKIYREKTGKMNKSTTTEEMRTFCQRPGKQDEDGNPIYFTEQAHKNECDINHILMKYDKTGLITNVSKFEGHFGDISGQDFKQMQDQIATAKTMFNQLPVEIRNRFDNKPAELLTFMDNPENRNEAIELGIIRKDWTPETDGLGEHVKEGENIKKIEE